MKYIFTILHNAECNFWEILKGDIERMAKQKNLEYAIEEVFIHDDEEARERKFAGSPQLLINGADVDPNASKILNYHASGCRPVMYRGTFYEYVPSALVEEVINSTPS